MGAKRRYQLLVAFAVLAATLLVTSVVWACTILVGSTETLTPSGGQGESVIEARGEVAHAVEDLSPQCDSTDGEANCDYNLIVIDPDDAVNPASGEAGSASCHYDTHERGIADDDPETNPDPTGSATILETNDGTVPSTTEAEDEDGDDSMGTGETVMCYASEQQNQADDANGDGQDGDGPATATQPVPFLITGSS